MIIRQIFNCNRQKVKYVSPQKRRVLKPNLQNAITSKHKKTGKRIATNINKEGVKDATEANIMEELKLIEKETVLSH